MFGSLKNYRKIEKHVLLLVGAEFLLRCIDGSFYILFNYHLKHLGYSDSQIANMITNRYAAVFLAALPVGLMIQGRKLLPLFYVSSITLPILSVLLLVGIHHHIWWLMEWCLRLWGVSFLFLTVAGLPLIMQNTNPESLSESISLYFQASGFSVFFAGMMNTLLHWISPSIFDEGTVLAIFSVLGFGSFFLIWEINIKEKNDSAHVPIRHAWRGYDWKAIGAVSTPSFLLAIGAGFTLPYVSLFFMNVHHIGSGSYSFFTSIAFVLSAIGMLFMPAIKRNLGYASAISIFQGLSIFVLIIMASTQWYSTLPIAMPIALVAYLLRQPLMNIAHPVTSELSMKLVGHQNREIVRSISAAVWSGSWFFTGLVFAILRSYKLDYGYIFLITVCLYTVGTVWYLVLLRKYKKELIEAEGGEYQPKRIITPKLMQVFSIFFRHSDQS